MNFLEYIKEGIEIAKLNKKTMKRIAKDRKATNMGIIILLLAGILSVVTMYKEESYVQVLIMAPIFTLVMFVLGVGLLQIFVKLFGGATAYVEMFRVLSMATVICWLWILIPVPYLGTILNWAVLIWGTVIAITAVEAVTGMTRGRAAATVAIPLVIAIMIILIVAMAAVQMI